MKNASTESKCANCARTAAEAGKSLKGCAKCHSVKYCGRECQKADWKQHKKVCASNAAANAGSDNTTSKTVPLNFTQQATNATNALKVTMDKPFHRLDSKTWLHDRPEVDVYKLLIDCYRLRMEDDYNLEGDADVDGLYGGAESGEPGFRRFLRLAEQKPALLPPWWSLEKRAACLVSGRKTGAWSDLTCAIEKSDLQEHYDDGAMPMQLRMLGEQIYGRGPGGQNGDEMRRLRMMTETGEAPGLLVDTSRFKFR